MNSSLHCRGQHRGSPSPVSNFRLSNLLPLVWRRLSIQFYLLEMHFSLLQIRFSVTLTSHMRIRSLKNKPTESFQLCHYSLLLGLQVFQMETTSLAFAAFTRRMCSLLKRYSARIRSNSLSAYTAQPTSGCSFWRLAAVLCHESKPIAGIASLPPLPIWDMYHLYLSCTALPHCPWELVYLPHSLLFLSKCPSRPSKHIRSFIPLTH